MSISDHIPPHYENEMGTILELPYTKVLHVPKPVFNFSNRVSNGRYVEIMIMKKRREKNKEKDKKV